MLLLMSPLVQAALATSFISLMPIGMLVCIFGRRTSKQQTINPHILRIFVCFAIGGLLGDAFLHLIPHAISPHSHSDTPPSPFMKQLEQWLQLSNHESHNQSVSNEPIFPFGASDIDSAWLDEAHPHLKPLDKENQDEHSHQHDHNNEHEYTHDHKHDHDQDHHDHAHDHEHVEHHDHGHDHDHGAEHRVGLLVLAGMGLFFVIEKFARLRSGVTGSSHGHSHSHGPSSKRKHSHDVDDSLAKHVSKLRVSDDESDDNTSNQSNNQSNTQSILIQRKTTKKQVAPVKSAALDEHVDVDEDVNEQARLTGLLNLIADMSHNFTDGLAIAASFLSSPALGLSTTIAVCVHEIPHEIGDFAILIQAGYSMKQAIVFQLYTAVGAMLGVAMIAVMGANDIKSLDWVLPVTAGGFVYVALINVAPAILNEQPRVAGEHWSGPWLRSTAEIGAILAGVGLMILIGQLE